MCSVQVTGIRLSIIVMVLFMLVVPGAFCQDRSDRVLPPPGPLYPKLYPSPTGRDGMEDVIRAADILSGIKLPPRAFSDSGSIEEERKTLQNPEVVRALDLVRSGLKKPMLPPPGDAMRFPTLATLRNVARFLAMEQRVLWADGQSRQALASFRDLLELSYVVQQGPLVSNLSGIAMEILGISVVAKQVPRLSQADCRQLKEILRERLKRPELAATVLDAEKREMAIRTPAGPEKQQILSALGRRYDALKKEFSKPFWQRRLPPYTSPDGRDSEVVQALVQSVDQSLSRALDVWATQQARLQLLYVHASIREHQLMNRRLPANLSELKLGPWALDPFSGNALQYRVKGPQSYDLFSVGPFERDAAGKQKKVRRPVRLAL